VLIELERCFIELAKGEARGVKSSKNYLVRALGAKRAGKVALWMFVRIGLRSFTAWPKSEAGDFHLPKTSTAWKRWLSGVKRRRLVLLRQNSLRLS
jgi:hypothetical protein